MVRLWVVSYGMRNKGASLTEHEPTNNLVSTRETKLCLQRLNARFGDDHGENNETNLYMSVSTNLDIGYDCIPGHQLGLAI